MGYFKAINNRRDRLTLQYQPAEMRKFRTLRQENIETVIQDPVK